MTQPRQEEMTGTLEHAKAVYERLVSGSAQPPPWWDVVVITSSSAKQAAKYSEEIADRTLRGLLPSGAKYLVVPDPGDQRVGTGGATLHALGEALTDAGCVLRNEDEVGEWCRNHSVLILHCGGDSRRMPQYSPGGKLFSPLPVSTPSGEISTVFDELLQLSALWAERASDGAVVASGDTIPVCDTKLLTWDRPGVSGVGIRETPEVGTRHGLYIVDEYGLVVSFLQKPSVAAMREAGAMGDDDLVAVDSGLLRFDAETTAALGAIGGIVAEQLTSGGGGAPIPGLDLYDHITRGLTGEWAPAADEGDYHREVHARLADARLWCDVVDGQFVHIGTTRHLQRVLSMADSYQTLLEATKQFGGSPSGPAHSSGVVIDSHLGDDSDLQPGSVVLESEVHVPLRAAAGGIAHGLRGLSQPVEIPAQTVFHQLPVRMPDGTRGDVVRAYAVDDDPKALASPGDAIWLGLPMLELIHDLELDPDDVWPSTPVPERSLWNADLFPVATPDEAMQFARWFAGVSREPLAEEWGRSPRLSLESSAALVDNERVAESRSERAEMRWEATAVDVAKSGSDVRPLLAHPPSVRTLARAGWAICAQADSAERTELTHAASLHYQGGMFLRHAGLLADADEAVAQAFTCVSTQIGERLTSASGRQWRGCRQADEVAVAAPARIDFGGGWSDTPPFCVDWGGSVFNAAVEFGNAPPIKATLRRLAEPVIRCSSVETGETVEIATEEQLAAIPTFGSEWSIPIAALRLARVITDRKPIADALTARGGGVEFINSVRLPMGSGLGTSSILAATVLRALFRMMGAEVTDVELSDHVLYLEQLMSTGGGWQDQAGGVFPGMKLTESRPGVPQTLRVRTVCCSDDHLKELESRFLLYYTGMRRVAKNLLAQVVGRYLAREAPVLQVLHRIKVLAVEMSEAAEAGDWDSLGRMMTEHWESNQVLDPHTTNTRINAILEICQPYMSGAKLAGAGGGGFLMVMAKDADAGAELRKRLQDAAPGGEVCPWSVAQDGMRVTTR